MRCFVDSDVVLDLLTRRSPFFEDAVQFFHAIEEAEAHASVASLTFANAYYLMMQEDKPLAEVRPRLEKFKLMVDVLSVDEKHIRRALRSHFRDFEDAIQYESALSAKVDCIVTRNVKDYRLAEIPVYTPADALKVIRHKR